MYESYYQTGNETLNVLLRDKARIAREKSIDFSAIVHFEDGKFLEPLDISTIFGNALDNAIEASEKLPPDRRMITVKTSRVGDGLMILVENNALEEEKREKRAKDGPQNRIIFSMDLVSQIFVNVWKNTKENVFYRRNREDLQ